MAQQGIPAVRIVERTNQNDMNQNWGKKVPITNTFVEFFYLLFLGHHSPLMGKEEKHTSP